jgi:hypothetical protein
VTLKTKKKKKKKERKKKEKLPKGNMLNSYSEDSKMFFKLRYLWSLLVEPDFRINPMVLFIEFGHLVEFYIKIHKTEISKQIGWLWMYLPVIQAFGKLM